MFGHRLLNVRAVHWLLCVLKRLLVLLIYCSFLCVNVCAYDGIAVDGANGFAEKNTLGHVVSRGVKATVARCGCVCLSVCVSQCYRL